ncbi:MAG: cytochrome P460 family protein, partial [Alphaproteobacteria bacterium]
MAQKSLTVMLLPLCAATFVASLSLAQEGPDSHFRVEQPARLSPPVAQSIYENAADDLAMGYGLSDYQPARDYRLWAKFNTFPYLSATHGNRYVNNFANAKASNYGELAEGEKMVPGAVLAKDSFTVTKGRRVFAAALFLMEKLEAGQNPDTADWRYVLVLPDGSVF